MFSSPSPNGGRRLNGSGAMQNGDDASKLRVMPSTGDPTDEVRASLASLTARAQRLVSEKDAEPLLRNGYGLYEASRKAAEEARHQASKCQSTSEGYAPATHASVELFMTQHLGFDAQAQQRLLQQLQHRHAQLGADLGPIDPMAAAEASGFMGITDVDAVVAEIQNDILLDVQYAVHRRQTALVRDQVDALFKAAWHPYYVRVADDYETLSMDAAEMTGSNSSHNRNSGCPSAGAAASQVLSASSAATAGTARSLLNLLNSDSALAAELNRRIAAFAAIVEEYAPQQWISYFTAYVTEASLDAADELTVLWATLSQLLEPLQRRGSAADVLSYVAASRRVMERKSLSRLLERVLRMDPMRFEEVENMSAAHVLDVVTRYCGTSNHWMHAFVAMRAGRYDVAQLVAQTIGLTALTNAMAAMAAAAPMERNALPPAIDLQPVYAEAATKEDPYRQAVLMILLAGRTGESSTAVVRAMLNLSQRITDSIEDALWLRLSCIRGVEESPQVSTVQSLRALQKAVLDDMQELVTLTQGSACRLASFLVHALLPSTGLRLMLENSYTHVDGFHMALCFNAQNLLQEGLSSSLEVPIDLARHMCRYSSVVLLDVDRRTRAAVFAGTAMFAYFYKSGLTEAFVDCCLKDTICARLLGSRNAVGKQDALLLHAGVSPLSEELLKALIQVAETASARGEVAKATHVLLAVTYLAGQLDRAELQQRALLRAVQMITPTLAQVLHLPQQSTVVSDVLSEAAQLLQVVNADEKHHLHGNALAAQDCDTFGLLCRMADVYAYHAQGNASDAVGAFLQLPFVPAPNNASMEGVETCVETYCNAPGSVQLGVNAVLPLVMTDARQLLQVYARSCASGVDVEDQQLYLLQRMRSVCDWARQCCVRTNVVYPAAADDFERQYLS